MRRGWQKTLCWLEDVEEILCRKKTKEGTRKQSINFMFCHQLATCQPGSLPRAERGKANLLHICINKLRQNLPNYPIEPVSVLNPAPFPLAWLRAKLSKLVSISCMLMTMSFHFRNGIIAECRLQTHYFYGHISEAESKGSPGLAWQHIGTCLFRTFSDDTRRPFCETAEITLGCQLEKLQVLEMSL